MAGGAKSESARKGAGGGRREESRSSGNVLFSRSAVQERCEARRRVAEVRRLVAVREQMLQTMSSSDEDETNKKKKKKENERLLMSYEPELVARVERERAKVTLTTKTHNVLLLCNGLKCFLFCFFPTSDEPHAPTTLRCTWTRRRS
jgi:hypothetical protein